MVALWKDSLLVESTDKTKDRPKPRSRSKQTLKFKVFVITKISMTYVFSESKNYEKDMQLQARHSRLRQNGAPRFRQRSLQLSISVIARLQFQKHSLFQHYQTILVKQIAAQAPHLRPVSKTVDMAEEEAANPLVSSLPASDSSPEIQLHPLVLLTISDYITRHTLRKQDGPIVGAVIGQQNGREITMEVAFECKTAAGPDGALLLDDGWFVKRLEQCWCF